MSNSVQQPVIHDPNLVREVVCDGPGRSWPLRQALGPVIFFRCKIITLLPFVFRIIVEKVKML
jgi:hypothetical protein